MPKELNLATRTQKIASVKMAIVVNFAKTLDPNVVSIITFMMSMTKLVKVSYLNIMVHKAFCKTKYFFMLMNSFNLFSGIHTIFNFRVSM